MKISRLLNWIYRFFLCIEKIGVNNTIKIFLHARLTNKQLKISLPNALEFKFRGYLDLGVMSHFYREVLGFNC